jgi:tRNA 2-thiouridine synthesizing protein C|tara:strand:+ start:48 stop:413 length:366 start_codon:yes stop_codon:yes gene_type:complete
LDADVKTLLFVNTRPPHGSVKAQEGLDALLMGSAFAECSALYLGDGILQLLDGQDTTQTDQKNFSLTFGALRDYGVDQVFCSKTQLDDKGLEPSDLVINVAALVDRDIAALFSSHDVVLNF